jgi:hypothetical protein
VNCEPGIFASEPGNKFGEPGITGNNDFLRRETVTRRDASSMPAKGDISIIRTRYAVVKPTADDTTISRPNRGGEG